MSKRYLLPSKPNCSIVKSSLNHVIIAKHQHSVMRAKLCRTMNIKFTSNFYLHPINISSKFQRGLCCFPGLGAVGARGGGRGEEALLLERQGRASQQTRSSSLPPPPSALPRPPRKPSTRTTRYDRLEHSRDARKVSWKQGMVWFIGCLRNVASN